MATLEQVEPSARLRIDGDFLFSSEALLPAIMRAPSPPPMARRYDLTNYLHLIFDKPICSKNKENAASHGNTKLKSVINNAYSSILVWPTGVVKVADIKNGNLELLTDKNSVLVLVDYQPTMFKSVGSGDKTRIKAAAIGAAKAASILGIPVVLSSINPKYNGDVIPEIAKTLPKSRGVCSKDTEF